MEATEWKKYRWSSATNEAFSGRAEKQDVTDRQCQHCGRWFSNRGVVGHEKGCEFKEWDGFRIDEDGFILSDVELGSAFIEVE